MKIVVLMGSPRQDSNTAALVEAFKKGAESKGNEVIVKNIAKMNIKPCVACEYCHTKGEGACIQKDDMQEIYPVLAEAEGVVIASPIYYFGLTGQAETALSRFYAPLKPAKAAKYAMILSSGSPGVYAGPEAQFNAMVGFFGAEVVGIVKIPGDQNRTEAALKEAEDLGAAF